MISITTIVALALGAALGGLIAWLLVRSRALLLGEKVRQSEQQLAQARAELEGKNSLILEASKTIAQLEATLEHERKAADEKIALLNRAKEELGNAFRALSAEALRNNNQEFLSLAETKFKDYQNQAKSELEKKEKAVETLVSPIKESLGRVTSQIQELEVNRKGAYEGLSAQVILLVDSQRELRAETSKLVQALHSPNVRGQWGQFQLRQVVEMTGMLPYCDFIEQATADTEDGIKRPDLIIKLPGGKRLVVDAKTPLIAYLESLEANDPKTKKALLKEHANQVRKHLNDLSKKSYYADFLPLTPEFVFMFIPKESFFLAALEEDSTLIEDGVKQHVILASPITLIAMLLTIAHVWDQEKLAEEAQKIADLGSKLYDAIGVLIDDHFHGLGNALINAVKHYNGVIGSLEGNILPKVRQFPQLGIAVKKEISSLEAIDESKGSIRSLKAPEFIERPPSGKREKDN